MLSKDELKALVLLKAIAVKGHAVRSAQWARARFKGVDDAIALTEMLCWPERCQQLLWTPFNRQWGGDYQLRWLAKDAHLTAAAWARYIAAETSSAVSKQPASHVAAGGLFGESIFEAEVLMDRMGSPARLAVASGRPTKGEPIPRAALTCAAALYIVLEGPVVRLLIRQYPEVS